ncbi:hypothetical protein [Streptomyces sp.]
MSQRRAAGRKLSKEQQELVLREWEVLRERLRSYASERVADAGDVLRAAELQPAGPTTQNTVRRNYEWALEAYEAAGKLLDEAADLPDLAAAVILAERAVERFAAAQAMSAGRRVRPPVTRCFYNPLHGAQQPTPRKTRRPARRIGRREAAADRRPACDSCRRAILAGQMPDVLLALMPVKASRRRTVRVLVPYYVLPQQWSLWSATACGAYGDDSPGLVLRGEHRRRTPEIAR